MTGTATCTNQRPVRRLAGDGCPRPGLLASVAERFRMSGYAKQHRLDGRLRVPR